MKSRFLSSLILLAGLCLALGSCLDTTGVTPYQQLQIDIEKIDAYLEENPPEDETDLVIKDAASGIRMVIKEYDLSTILLPPRANNKIEVAYTGYLFSNGEQFDTNDSYTLKLSNDIIQGWKVALGMMTEGMEATVYIPSGLAYGTSGKGDIPKNAILVFDLHLIDVDRADETTQLTADKIEIAQKLDAEGIEAQTHESGFSYVIEPTGSGPMPLLYDQVTIKYTGRLIEDDVLLADGTIFADGIEQGPVSTFSSRVVNYYVHGLLGGLQLMHEGDKATFYIPSTLAYGASSSEIIPGNANVIFEVELLTVTPYSNESTLLRNK